MRLRDFAIGLLVGAVLAGGVSAASSDRRSEARKLHDETPATSIYTISELKAIYLLEMEQLDLLDQLAPTSRANANDRARLFSLLEDIRDNLKGGRKGTGLPSATLTG